MVADQNLKIKIVIDNLYDEEEELKIDDDIILDKLEETITNENSSLNDAASTQTNRYDSISQRSNPKRLFNWGSVSGNLDDRKQKVDSSTADLSDNQIAYL